MRIAPKRKRTIHLGCYDVGVTPDQFPTFNHTMNDLSSALARIESQIESRTDAQPNRLLQRPKAKVPVGTRIATREITRRVSTLGDSFLRECDAALSDTLKEMKITGVKSFRVYLGDDPESLWKDWVLFCVVWE